VLPELAHEGRIGCVRHLCLSIELVLLPVSDGSVRRGLVEEELEERHGLSARCCG